MFQRFLDTLIEKSSVHAADDWKLQYPPKNNRQNNNNNNIQYNYNNKNSLESNTNNKNDNNDGPKKPSFSTASAIGAGATLLALGVAAGLGLLAFYTRRYRRCPANQILVIQGKFANLEGGAKCIHGGGAFVWPIIQEWNYLSLEPLRIDAPLKHALSQENIRVNVPSVFTVAISSNEEIMPNAAKRLLGLTTEEVNDQAKDIIYGQLRQVIASMKIEEINRSRERFVSMVSQNIGSELNKIGLELINVNIRDVTDESGYLEALGRKSAQQAISKAEVDVAEQSKLGSIGTSSHNKERDLAVAELAKEKQVGEAHAKYTQAAEIKKKEQEMRVSTASSDAKAIHGENAARAQIAESQALLEVKTAQALIKTQEAQAEAEKSKLLLLQSQREAELIGPAKAQQSAKLVEAETWAKDRLIRAEAEANSILSLKNAQAQAEFQFLKAKADGFHQLVKSSGSASDAAKLLMIEHVDELAKTSAQAISNIKFDKIVVWEGGKDGESSTANFVKGFAKSLPPMLNVLTEVGGLSPDYFNQLKDLSSDQSSTSNRIIEADAENKKN